MVKRFEIAPFSEFADNTIHFMKETKDGDYVAYADYTALEARYKEALIKAYREGYLAGMGEHDEIDKETAAWWAIDYVKNQM